MAPTMTVEIAATQEELETLQKQLPERLQRYSEHLKQSGLPSGEIARLLNQEKQKANKEIALALTIGEQTVKNNLSAIFHKLGVTNRLELALYAWARGQVVEALAAVPACPSHGTWKGRT